MYRIVVVVILIFMILMLLLVQRRMMMPVSGIMTMLRRGYNTSAMKADHGTDIERMTGRTENVVSDTSTRRTSRTQRAQNLIVLDLDETLVHSTPDGTAPGGFKVEVRPHASDFLRAVDAAFAEVAVFTAGTRAYADDVINMLENVSGVRIGRRLFRDSCTVLPDGLVTKDITKFGVPLSSVVIVDNTPTAYKLNPSNGIPITSWMGTGVDAAYSRKDTALLDMLPMLVNEVASADDVRDVVHKMYGEPRENT